MVIYFTQNFTGVLEYIKETFWMLPVSIIKKKYFRGLSNSSWYQIEKNKVLSITILI